MSWQFGRINLVITNYQVDLAWKILDPVPVADVLRVYRDYCTHKHFHSVIPMIPGRLTASQTEIIGYQDQDRLVAWSMYRLWDAENVLSDHHAWDYRNPRQRLGIRSLKNECAIYRDRGYRWMYFESVQPYMLDLEGFETLGPIR
jgi:hypothetical protein